MGRLLTEMMVLIGDNGGHIYNQPIIMASPFEERLLSYFILQEIDGVKANLDALKP